MEILGVLILVTFTAWLFDRLGEERGEVKGITAMLREIAAEKKIKYEQSLPKNQNLAEELSKKLDDPNLPKDYTVNDFFDEMGIQLRDRNDFAMAAILRQVDELRKQKEV
ncbi:hypothetical protein LCGC14_1251230 [marine sediment metagenome]|uniref:Uncharacterized protein n=1 Tax=marine sediment metagenome TaxID=412755 RepID=A0A0F9NK47_9ZZZZ